MRKFVVLMALLVGVLWFNYGEAARATGPMTLTGFICAKASEGTKCLGDYPAGGGAWDGPEAAVALEANDQAFVFLTSGLAVYKYATGTISDDASNTPPLTVAASGGGGWNLQAVNPSSMTIPKTSGTAGVSCVYDGNSTDTDQTCWEGAANRTGKLTLKHSNSDPAANQVMVFPAPTNGSSTYTWTDHSDSSAGQTKITNGASPTIDAAGKIAVDTTTDQLQYYGAAKIAIPPKRFFSVVVPSVADTDDMFILKLPWGITVTSLDCIVSAATSATINIQECGSDGTSCTDMATSDLACDTDGANTTTFNNAAADANDWLKLDVASISGTPGTLTVTVTYTVTPD